MNQDNSPLLRGKYSDDVEVRMKEEMNPVEGGDTYTVQVNQIALDRLGAYSDKISSNESGQQSPVEG